MHIKIDCEKIQGDYQIEVRLEEAESAEFQEAVKRNSPPKAEVGGIFTETVTKEVVNEDTGEATIEESEVELFRFVSKVIELTSDLPYVRVFKKSQYGEDAERFAELYSIEIKERLEAELDKLREDDAFSNKDLDVIF